MVLPDVAPVLGRSIAASLVGLAAPAMAPTPLVVAEQATVTASGQEQPDVAVVVFEGVAQSVPLVATETAPDVDQAELDAAMVASEGAA